MRHKFIQAFTYQQAKEEAPLWHTMLAKVNGGYMAFESDIDYRIWIRRNPGRRPQ